MPEPRDYSGETVWIIGASSGIGAALAQSLHRRGANLVLSARNQAALQELKQKLGDKVLLAPLDVQDRAAIAARFAEIIQQTQLDRVIVLAGSYEPMKIRDLDPIKTAAIIATNLCGTIDVTQQVLPYFLQRRHGQIALCGSVAGYRGLPNSQPYGATKAAIINFAESLRAECAGSDVDIRLINPGFVRTRLTDKNSFAMPMRIEPETAADIIADGLNRAAFEIHFPKKFTLLVKLLGLLPDSLYFRLASRLA